MLAFLSGVDDRIFDDVYVPLGDVFDVAVLINSAVNFIVSLLLQCTVITILHWCECTIHTYDVTHSGRFSFLPAVNFVLYCTMSRQFRQTFGELFLGWTAAANGKYKKSTAASSARASAQRL